MPRPPFLSRPCRFYAAVRPDRARVSPRLEILCIIPGHRRDLITGNPGESTPECDRRGRSAPAVRGKYLRGNAAVPAKSILRGNARVD